jgi:hypothetical protein
MIWGTMSVLVPLIRVPKRLMTGRLTNWMTFSVPHITPRHNTLLKTGVDIVGILSWCPTVRTRRVRCLWCWTSTSTTTVSEVALTLVLTVTYITLNNNPPSVVSFMCSIPSTSGRLHSEFIRLLFLQAHRETDRLFTTSGVQLAQHDRGLFHFRRTVFSVTLTAKVGNTLVKDAALRISLNIDGAPITSRTHTHPSHSQTSRLLTSSLS